jgi:formylglycine-generating enzyme required for sulfatase activity
MNTIVGIATLIIVGATPVADGESGGPRGGLLSPSRAQLEGADIYKRSRALVIGIDGYRALPKLRSAVADAQAVRRILLAQGFEVDVLLDAEATAVSIRTKLGDTYPREMGKDDRFIVYFAGHGVTTGESQDPMGYLMPQDADGERPVATGISMEEVQRWFSRYSAKHVMFVADTCYSGLALSSRSTSLPSNTPNYLRRVTKESVRFALVAGASTEEAFESHGHGLFTGVLLEGLGGAADHDSNGFITSAELATFVVPRVSEAAIQLFNRAQTPQYGRVGGGEFVFVNPSVTPKAPAPEGDTDMVTVPAGVVKMGCRDGDARLLACLEADAKRDVFVPGFEMDRTEVTVAAFLSCVDAGTCSAEGVDTQTVFAPDPGWCNAPREDRKLHPMNCISAEQATIFCGWKGKRLPTEEEWERAARGNDERGYPWGDQRLAPGAMVANVDDSAICRARTATRSFTRGELDGWSETSPVGTYPAGASPFGVLDLVGNVWEYTSTAAGASVIKRGGAFLGKPNWHCLSDGPRVHWRLLTPTDSARDRRYDTGFRCARTPKLQP